MPDHICPCSHDCFTCPYDDCICGDDEINDMTALEIAEAEARDRRTERYNCEADYDGEDTATEKQRKRRTYRRTYYYRHHHAELAKRKEKREKDRDAINAKKLDYYYRNKDQINQKRRERRALEKARQEAENNMKTGGNHGKNS